MKLRPATEPPRPCLVIGRGAIIRARLNEALLWGAEEESQTCKSHVSVFSISCGGSLPNQRAAVMSGPN